MEWLADLTWAQTDSCNAAGDLMICCDSLVAIQSKVLVEGMTLDLLKIITVKLNTFEK